MGYKMKGFSGFGSSPAKQKIDPDAPGTPGKPGYEPEVKSMDYLTRTPNPTTKAIHRKVDTDDWSEDEFQNKGDFNISNLHKDTNIKLAKDHNVSANITEGSVESQKLRRKENAKKKMKKDRPYPKWQNADEVD